MEDNLYKKISIVLDNEWIPIHQDEWFGFDDVARYYDWRDRDTRDALSQNLYYRYKKQSPPSLEKRGKLYKFIDMTLEEVKFWESETKLLDIRLPFEMEKYVKIPPASLIVVGGTWGEGKSAWAYNTIFLNMDNIDTVLYNSEMADELIKERCEDYANHIPFPPPFRTYNKYTDFHHSVSQNPNSLNVIDYLSVDGDKMNLVRDDLRRILHALDKGVAVVLLQKPSGRDTAYGGEPTLWDCTLGLSMEKGKCKILKCRRPADPTVNPKNMVYSYKLSKGINFYEVHTVLE